MAKLMNIATLFLFSLLLISTAKAQTVIDVTRHGADGDTDIKEALASAWKEACASTSPSKILIPEGSFSLGPLTMEGPCKAAIQVEVKAVVIALTEEVKNGSWIKFQRIEGFKLFGGGTFGGQGSKAWGTCDNYCKQLPTNLWFDSVTDGLVQDITSLNSKQFHVNVLGCKNFTFDNFTVITSDHSPIIDGIHIRRSTGINITNSVIKADDHCISIGDGSKEVSITKVNCGLGHGISVGSLEENQNEEPVEGITINDCKFNNHYKKTSFP